MSDQKVMNRWLVVVGAILIQLSLGAIYAWSVFTPMLGSKNAYKIAMLYQAPMLEISAEKYADMKQALDARDEDGKMVEGSPNQRLVAVGNELKLLKGKTDEASTAKAAELKEAKAAIEKEMDAITLAHVEPDTIDKLTYGFTKVQNQMIFAAGLALFAIVMVLAGRMMPRTGPRKLAMAGGVVLGLGYLLAGLVAGKSFWLHFIFIGIVGGSGIGLGYVVPIAVAMRWFPDKKGLITGLAVAGFGFGATLWVKLGGAWGGLLAAQGLPQTFVIYGIMFAAMVILGGLWMVFPPEGWLPKGYTPPEPKAADGSVKKVDYTSGQMLATPQYYMILLMFIFGAGAGLMSIGLMKAYPIQALSAGGMELAAASAVAGTAMAIFFSLANGIGRIAWGTISDYIGRKASMFIMMALQAGTMIAFPYMAGNVGLLYLGATLIGFNFGGNFALFPAMTTDTFGAKHIGQNYGWVFLGYGIGGIVGPIMGGKLGALGNFPLAFTICGICCAVAAVITFGVKPPKAAAVAVDESDAKKPSESTTRKAPAPADEVPASEMATRKAEQPSALATEGKAEAGPAAEEGADAPKDDDQPADA